MRAYFDHNATTPLSEIALAAFTEALRDLPGNASSIHREGQAAKQRLEAARRQIATLAHARPDEVVFTSGATEANNLALFGVLAASGSKRHIITTAIEHPAVLNPAQELEATILPVDSNGLVDPDDVRRALRPDTALISVMTANNELGTLQPIAEIAALAREAQVPFHTDAVQALGKIALPAEYDLLSLSAHKAYGPKGVGALIVRKGMPLRRIVFGGHHERDRRPGTENTPAVVAFAAACGDLNLDAQIAALRDHLEQSILDRIPRTRVNAAGAPRLPNTSNILFEGIEGEALVIGLDLKGFAISSGAACSSGAVEPSHVLTAIGLSRDDARSCLRFSLGRSNTRDQIDSLVDALTEVTARLRKLSPAYV